MTRQAQIVSISRNPVFYEREPLSDADLQLMRRMGITALYGKPNTSRRAPGHPILSYLMRTLAITPSDKVWAMDVTLYLVVVIDWHDRRVLRGACRS